LWANPPDALAKYDLLTYCTCRNHLYLGPFEISTQEGLTAKLKEDGGFFAHEKVWLLEGCLMVRLKAATVPILKHIETKYIRFSTSIRTLGSEGSQDSVSSKTIQNSF